MLKVAALPIQELAFVCMLGTKIALHLPNGIVIIVDRHVVLWTKPAAALPAVALCVSEQDCMRARCTVDQEVLQV